MQGFGTKYQSAATPHLLVLTLDKGEDKWLPGTSYVALSLPEFIFLSSGIKVFLWANENKSVV